MQSSKPSIGLAFDENAYLEDNEDDSARISEYIKACKMTELMKLEILNT